MTVKEPFPIAINSIKFHKANIKKKKKNKKN